MSDKISSFINFISNDPIMLGLCIAIIVLVIAFILVLFLGKKKEEVDEVVDNTTELLKTEVDLDALKSTQEFSVSEIQASAESKNQEETVTSEPVNQLEPNQIGQEENIETFNSLELNNQSQSEPVSENTIVPSFDAPSIHTETIEEVPVTIEEPVPLEIPIMEQPIINEEFKINEPVIDVPQVENQNISSFEPVFDINPTSITEDTITQIALDENTIEPIVESTVSPIEDSSFDDAFKEPSVNIDSNAFNINSDYDFTRDFNLNSEPVINDNTAELNKNETTIEEPKEEVDDLVLPKLNKNIQTNDFVNSLQGESFDIR